MALNKNLRRIKGKRGTSKVRKNKDKRATNTKEMGDNLLDVLVDMILLVS